MHYESVPKCFFFLSLPLIKTRDIKRERTVHFGTFCDSSRETYYQNCGVVHKNVSQGYNKVNLHIMKNLHFCYVSIHTKC